MISKKIKNKTVGILMAGGFGTRLYPTTKVLNKHLINIYDKPMIYYSLSILMLAKINEIAIVSSKKDVEIFKKLFENSKDLGLKLKFIVQKKPKGIAEGILLSKKFIANRNIMLVLGDNLIYGNSLTSNLISAKNQLTEHTAQIFGCFSNNPNMFGVIQFDKKNQIRKIIEKPKKFISNYAVPGIYFYGNNVLKHITKLKYSNRGELEITDLNNIYISNKLMKVSIFGRGINWLDTGTPEGLLEASNFVSAVQKSSGNKIACIEEIALNNKWISNKYLKKLIDNIYKNSFYKNYIGKLVE